MKPRSPARRNATAFTSESSSAPSTRPVGSLAVELQRAVRLEEVEVAADLNGTVAGVGDGDDRSFAAYVQVHVAIGGE